MYPKNKEEDGLRKERKINISILDTVYIAIGEEKYLRVILETTFLLYNVNVPISINS